MKLFIATPMYGGQCCAEYALGLLGLQRELLKADIPYLVGITKDCCYVTKARNVLADQFMGTDCTHILWLDADMGFDASGTMKMLAHSDCDVIGAGYPKKTINWGRIRHAVRRNHNIKTDMLAALAGDYTFQPVSVGDTLPLDKPVEVVNVATGHMLVARDVFEKLQPHVPSYRDDGKTVYSYFDTLVEDNQYIGEDFLFCKRWRKIGGKVWLAPWVNTVHMGMMAFPGNIAAVAASGEGLTCI